jgi:hypothetical protein
MQRFSQAVAIQLHHQFRVAMVGLLGDWLIFCLSPPAYIQHELLHLGITTNFCSHLSLNINVTEQTITPTPHCLNHLMELLALEPMASAQDLMADHMLHYMGLLSHGLVYVPCDLTSPAFLLLALVATHDLLQQPHHMVQLYHTTKFYMVTTLTSLAATDLGLPYLALYCQKI